VVEAIKLSPVLLVAAKDGTACGASVRLCGGGVRVELKGSENLGEAALSLNLDRCLTDTKQ
jgi:hypothetical protein